jgi:hypothetical protein
MTEKLLQKARAEDRGPAFDRLALIFMLSRTLRNKAPLDSYLVGIELEDKALNGLDDWLARGMPDAQVLRQVLVELNRHAKETPPPSDCVKTECYRSGGVVENPAMWTFSTPGGNGRMPERWLANGIAVSLEAPWEAERKMRIWRLVWSGLIRNLETPHWELPESPAEVRADKAMTHKIMEGYLPEVGGTSQERVVRLLDSSWLPDEQIFPSVKRLRKSATRARWRAEAMRQVVALGLHQLEQGKAAPDLDALVPNYFPAALPIDPYSGKSYRYRLDAQNGQADLWSTGPDRIDHGGRRDGQHLDDDQPGWRRGELDLIVPVPAWR